jgi:hypothetical protein
MAFPPFVAEKTIPHSFSSQTSSLIWEFSKLSEIIAIVVVFRSQNTETYLEMIIFGVCTGEHLVSRAPPLSDSCDGTWRYRLSPRSQSKENCLITDWIQRMMENRGNQRATIIFPLARFHCFRIAFALLSHCIRVWKTWIWLSRCQLTKYGVTSPVTSLYLWILHFDWRNLTHISVKSWYLSHCVLEEASEPLSIHLSFLWLTHDHSLFICHTRSLTATLFQLTPLEHIRWSLDLPWGSLSYCYSKLFYCDNLPVLLRISDPVL